MLGRASLQTRDKHPELRHHEDILDLVNPESVVEPIELGDFVKVGVRHGEGDGLVMGEVKVVGAGWASGGEKDSRNSQGKGLAGWASGRDRSSRC